MKLSVISAILVLLAACTVSAQEEETFLSSALHYVQDVASDVATKTTDALNQVKEMPLAQQAIEYYDAGADFVSSYYSSIMSKTMERWEQLTKSF